MERKRIKKVIVGIILGIIVLGFALLIAYFAVPYFARAKLKFNIPLGNTAVKKIENAQYTPDLNKYYQAKSSQAKPMASRSDETSSETFADLINEYATVYNYAGAGKYLGYDIYEIKDEIKFVVQHVPAFNQWFRMPPMRENEGFLTIPYYENWAYYLEMNEATSELSITRVSWATRSRYLDFDKRKSIEDHEDGSSFIQFEVMKINYLDNGTDEIVECLLYSVGIDHVKGSSDLDFLEIIPTNYNKNSSDYYPFEFQYLRNVKDKSMVKYHITVANRYRSDDSFDEGGMDIRGLTPYGIRREFTVVNYDGYANIDVTKIDQQFATLDKAWNNGKIDFDVDSNNIRILLDAIKFEDEVSSLSCKEFLDEISKHIVDNFELKNNWPTIYKESAVATDAETVYGPFYGKEMWLTNVHPYVSCRSQTQNEIEFKVSASIYDISKFDLTKEYSLSMALKSRETDKLFVIGTHYELPKKVFYNGSATEFYHSFSQNIDVNSSKISVDEDGTYDIVCVLTKREKGKDIILFDTQVIAYLQSFYGLKIPDHIDKNGITHRYTVNTTGGKITITATSLLSPDEKIGL